jgi:hypothetical protein
MGGTNAVITDNVIRNRDLTFSDYGIWLHAGTINTLLYGNSFSMVPGAIRDDGSGNKVVPKIHSVGKTNSMMTIRGSGLPGTNYRLERSIDFVSWDRVSDVICPAEASFVIQFPVNPGRITPNQHFRMRSQ